MAWLEKAKASIKQRRIRVCNCPNCSNVTEKAPDRYVIGDDIRQFSWTMCAWCHEAFITSHLTESWLIEPGSLQIAG